MECSPPGSSVHGDPPGKNTGMGCHAVLQGLFPTRPGIEPRSPALQVDSLPSESPGKAKNTGVGILSVLQGKFSRGTSQSRNQTGVSCIARQILYQLSYQGNPFKAISRSKFYMSLDFSTLKSGSRVGRREVACLLQLVPHSNPPTIALFYNRRVSHTCLLSLGLEWWW